ncbi:MAG: DNA polymerase III subunit gamma/tau [Saprospiraceae bacterium]|nr:DNA polymerase III subunit gamma/tau [Saprospiraceae bacterium]MCB9327989.1 DNA polymerase III subunit gamma/tau [Lewinellaceae bacterium]HPK09464.1 DNA polymerase III subunit gamma/tau [Saprospiraceae bacterium]
MSNFLVSARKYRPLRFEDVVGQNHVAKTLKNALHNDKLAHAFLFCGPRGVGKTTCARILAKVINCENPIDKVDPCNECKSCKSFNDNASFNILELDAASNNSVEHIRTLIDQVRFPPQGGSHKVFIIDEVHMLTSQAFNAFLKTLEEPPPYAIFILATTEKHKIIPTILSRCQIYDFKRIQLNDIVSQLQQIANQESIEAETEALHVIAQKADGAMRDALSIFDKIAGSSEGKISYKETIQNLNILDYEYFFKITDACLREDFSDVLITTNEIINYGFDPEQIITGLGEHLRELLITKDNRTLEILEISDVLKDRYINQSRIADSSFLLTSLNVLNQCEVQLPMAKNKRLHSEIALSKLCYYGKTIEKGPEIFVADTEKKTKVVSKAEQKSLEEKNQVETVKEPELSIKSPTPEKSNLKNELQNTPSFTSVNDILEKISQDEKQKAEAKQFFNLDSINKIWLSYAENNPSKSVELACKNALLSLDKHNLLVTVPNILAKDIVQQEMSLIDRIREELGTPEMTVSYHIDVSQFPDYEESQPKNNLSMREKYDMMVEKNANLRDLVKKLNLVPDNEVIN